MTEFLPITAAALDRWVDLDCATSRLPWPETRRLPYASVYRPEGVGDLYLFRFGAVVLDSAGAIDPARIADLEAATGCRLLPQTSETYYVGVDPEQSAAAPRVGWDRVVIPERSPELVGAVALLLGQSAALERYEHAADGLLDESLALSQDLASAGRLPHSTRALVRRVGRITRDRLELARWFYLIDRPEGTWEDPRIAGLYDALFDNLELAQRHQAMLHKLNAVESATATAIDLWHGRRSNALEWAIVLLIVFEIVLAMARGL